MLARIARTTALRAAPRHAISARPQIALRPVASSRRWQTQQAQAHSAESGSWLAKFIGGAYSRFAAPQPNIHLHELAMKANIPVDTLQLLWKKFIDIDTSKDTGDGLLGDARISCGELEPLLEEAGVGDPAFRKALFDAFDADRCGTIDFREFISGLALLSSDKTDDRAVLVFCLFDLDGSREICKDEMQASLKSVIMANHRIAQQKLPSVPGTEELSEDARAQILAQVTTDEVFEFCDSDKNGILDLEEFRAWLKSGHPSAVLVSSWFEEFSERYRNTLVEYDNKHQASLTQANKDWLASGRAKSWHERAVLTGMYGRVDKPAV